MNSEGLSRVSFVSFFLRPDIAATAQCIDPEDSLRLNAVFFFFFSLRLSSYIESINLCRFSIEEHQLLFSSRKIQNKKFLHFHIYSHRNASNSTLYLVMKFCCDGIRMAWTTCFKTGVCFLAPNFCFVFCLFGFLFCSDIPATTPQIHHSTQPEDSLRRHTNTMEGMLQDPRLLPHARGHVLDNHPMMRGAAGLRATMLGALHPGGPSGGATDAFRRGFLHQLGQRLSSVCVGTPNQNSAALHLLHHNAHPSAQISQKMGHTGMRSVCLCTRPRTY